MAQLDLVTLGIVKRYTATIPDGESAGDFSDCFACPVANAVAPIIGEPFDALASYGKPSGEYERRIPFSREVSQLLNAFHDYITEREEGRKWRDGTLTGAEVRALIAKVESN